MLSTKDLDLILRAEIAAAQILEGLLERIFNDQGEDDARATIRQLADRLDDESAASLSVFAHYRGMRSSLDEEDFRWGASQATPLSVLRKLRRARRRQYLQYLEMFSLNVQLALASRGSTMSLGADWSSLDDYLSDGAQMFKCRAQLRFAAELFRWERPGALEVCDNAVFSLLRLVYLRPSPAA
jgi:hypothetical protein